LSVEGDASSSFVDPRWLCTTTLGLLCSTLVVWGTVCCMQWNMTREGTVWEYHIVQR